MSRWPGSGLNRAEVALRASSEEKSRVMSCGEQEAAVSPGKI
jgi:hypothetical protein